MAKFWEGSSTPSDSASDSSDSEAPAVAAAAPTARLARTRWAEESSSDDEVVQKRVVKRTSDKRLDQLVDRIKTMKNHQKIGDFPSLITDYETINKMFDKMKNTNDMDGTPPASFVRAITNLEVYIAECFEEQKEKRQNKSERLTESKQKAFNTLRAKVRKGNKAYETLIEECKTSPEAYESDAESEPPSEESESSDSGEAESDAESSDDDSSSGSSSSDSDSSSSSGSSSSSSSSSGSESSSGSDSGSLSSDYSEKGSGKNASSSDDDADEESAREKKMLRWLITPEKLAKRQKAHDDKKNQQSEKVKKTDKYSTKTKKTAKAGEPDAPKSTKEPEEYTAVELMKKVEEIAQQRGRRGFDRRSYMEKLEGLMVHAVKIGPLAQLYVYSSMTSADFDNASSAFQPMRLDYWNEALDKVNKMMPLVSDLYDEVQESGVQDRLVVVDGDEDGDPKSFPKQQELFVAFIEKLDDELYKAMQFTVDVYGSEYQEILGNSSQFLVLIRRALKFFERTRQTQHLGSLSLRLMEHLYYKPDILNGKVFEAIHYQVPEEEKEYWIWPEDSRAYMAELCRNVHSARNTQNQTRASLCQAFHLALHEHFQPARDLLHLGNFVEHIDEAEISTKILYNRVLAQMGLCAFRLGKIKEAHDCLMSLCLYNKARELLAQGLSFNKAMDRTAEQERAERLRQLPYHMHINLEVLESAHHITAMLLEVPHSAMQSILPSNGRPESRVLRRALEQYDKQPFAGPPENAKESVVVAAKSLQRGDWASACEVLEELKLWDHIDPSSAEAGVKVKEMIKEKIKTEALRTYLFSYASIYDAFHLNQLVGMFDLEPKVVHSIVSKMMIEEKISAFWDESSKFVLMQHSEPTQLQRLALTLADRAASAVEGNERLLDQKTGGFSFKDQRGGNRGGWDPNAAGDRRRFGKGQSLQNGDGKGGKGKGRGKSMSTGMARNRGWENARAGALRGGAASRPSPSQRGWNTARP